MNDPTIKELQAQNQQLRDQVVLLSPALLRKIAVESEMHRSLGSAEELVSEAEECFRCARIPGLKSEIAEGLEVAGREFMAKAVEIETELQRVRRKK